MNDALLDFLRESPDGLLQVEDPEVSRLVLTELFKEGKLSPLEMLERACSSPHSGQLVLFVAELFRPTDGWRNFLVSCLRNWDRWEDVKFPPAFKDEYAQMCVRRFIAKRDYRRAWDEINKLRKHGFFAEGAEEEEAHIFFVSPECLKQLVEELFGEMKKRKIVAPLDSSDYVCMTDSIRREAYETRLPRTHRHKPRSFITTAKRPGWEFAKLFGCDQHRHDKPDGPCIFTLDYQLTPVGGMILRIAEHFARKRIRARQKKHQKALERFRAQK